MERRAFLVGSAALVASACTPADRSAAPASTGSASAADWAELQKLLGERFIPAKGAVPGNARYLTFATAMGNTRYWWVLPGGIARCESEADVATCLKWAQETGTEFSIRSGSHNYAGTSQTTGLLISTAGMREINVDAKKELLTVGAGVRTGDIARVLARTPGRGGLMLPMGVCPSVGISGLALGGGLGYNSRTAGATCDSLVGSNVVLADGRIVRTDASSEPDLFWAIRGAGGGNFGVNTNFQFRLTPVPRQTVFAFAIEFLGEAMVRDGIHAWNTVISDAPRELSTSAILSAPGSPDQEEMARAQGVGATVYGQFIGSEDDARALLEPLLRVKSHNRIIGQRSFWDAQRFLQANNVALFDGGPDPMFQNAFWCRSRFINGRIDARLLDITIDHLVRNRVLPPGDETAPPLQIAFQQWVGGRVNDITPDATAFVHRSSSVIMQITTTFQRPPEPYRSSETRPVGWVEPVPPARRVWAEELWKAAEPFVSQSSYQNFPDPDLADWQRAYYGANFDRLRQVKSRYDPGNVFRFPQSIPTA